MRLDLPPTLVIGRRLNQGHSIQDQVELSTSPSFEGTRGGGSGVLCILANALLSLSSLLSPVDDFYAATSFLPVSISFRCRGSATEQAKLAVATFFSSLDIGLIPSATFSFTLQNLTCPSSVLITWRLQVVPSLPYNSPLCHFFS